MSIGDWPSLPVTVAAGAPSPELRRALLISAGWLSALAERFKLDQDATTTTLRHGGTVIGEFTLGQALDLADRALRPCGECHLAAGETCDICGRSEGSYV